MVKVEITIKCDKCGKEKKGTFIAKGYDEPESMISNKDEAYAPMGWIHQFDDDDEIGFVNCKKCSKEFHDANPGSWGA